MNTLKKTVSLFQRVIKSHKSLKLTTASCTTVSKPDEEKCIVVDKIDDNLITTIGINRPHRKNALDKSTANYLAEAFEEFENDKESLVAVLHGCGGNFCAGYDLHEIAEFDGKSENDVPQFGKLSNWGGTPFRKPRIASINGYAVGVGLELALLCDLRVLDDTAVLGFFNRRFGIPIFLGGFVHLPRIVGYGRAMDMILRGRPVNAKEAMSWGLATEVVACGSALGQAVMMAKSLTKFPQKTLQTDHAATWNATFSSETLEEKIKFAHDFGAHLLYEEGVSGAKRFQQGYGRHGNFKNLVNRTKIVKELDKDLL